MPLWMRRVWIQLTSDRRRMGALAGCVLLGLLLWARIIIVSNMPRTAVANEPGGGVKSGNAVGAGMVSKEDSPKAARVDQEVRLDTVPTHDPFVISPEFFPRPTQTTPAEDDGSKSGAEQAEDAVQIEARQVARLQAMVAPLRLEASLGESMAVISGRSYRRGEVIVGPWSEDVRFVLSEVKQRSVILESEGRRFELKMASPGRE